MRMVQSRLHLIYVNECECGCAWDGDPLTGVPVTGAWAWLVPLASGSCHCQRRARGGRGRSADALHDGRSTLQHSSLLVVVLVGRGVAVFGRYLLSAWLTVSACLVMSDVGVMSE